MPRIIQENLLAMVDNVLGSIQSSKYSVDEISGLRQALARSPAPNMPSAAKNPKDKDKDKSNTPPAPAPAEEKPAEA